VFTNALLVAQIVAAKPQLTCHTLGGRVRTTTLAEVGAAARRGLSDLHFDIAFMGTNAISFTRGLSTPDPEEAAIKRAMIASSERVVILTDHTKFAQTSLVRFAELSDIDLVIAGTETEMSHRAALTECGLEARFA
jgi:DeoR family fructose operon transcriptional repressor